uniref:Uncharacterized protein n=1 Tax=Sphaerodactylus townsendi TaxID=933632 RepID=A0ACB8EQQ0_9SAUR
MSRPPLSLFFFRLNIPRYYDSLAMPITLFGFSIMLSFKHLITKLVLTANNSNQPKQGKVSEDQRGMVCELALIQQLEVSLLQERVVSYNHVAICFGIQIKMPDSLTDLQTNDTGMLKCLWFARSIILMTFGEIS